MCLMVFSVLLFNVSSADQAVEPNQNATNTESSSSSSILSGVTPEKAEEAFKGAGNTAMNVAQNILDQVVMWALPFCALAIVWGAVQYFVLGIRNLYRKRQGLLLMWGSLTFYVIALFANLIITFMIGF